MKGGVFLKNRHSIDFNPKSVIGKKMVHLNMAPVSISQARLPNLKNLLNQHQQILSPHTFKNRNVIEIEAKVDLSPQRLQYGSRGAAYNDENTNEYEGTKEHFYE